MENRRLFLKRASGAALCALAGRCLAQITSPASEDEVRGLPHLTTLPDRGPIPERIKSVVVINRNPMILSGSKLHEGALTSLLEETVRIITDCESTRQAWRKLVSDGDVVGIKFDPVGYEKLNTTDVLADCLVRSLEKAGFKRERIVLIEVPDALTQVLGTLRPAHGWQEHETRFASGRERLAKVLDQVTAIINVPFLKTDNTTGIAGALRNVSLPFVRQQEPYFANGGAPGIAEIVAIPPIRSKLKLHLVNGLRAVFDRGPEVHTNGVWPFAGILAGTDPVAVDSVSIDVINTRRLEANLPPIGDANGRLPHVHAAGRAGLGTDDQDYIRIVTPHNT